jgi:hypothetical protein
VGSHSQAEPLDTSEALLHHDFVSWLYSRAKYRFPVIRWTPFLIHSRHPVPPDVPIPLGAREGASRLLEPGVLGVFSDQLVREDPMGGWDVRW